MYMLNMSADLIPGENDLLLLSYAKLFLRFQSCYGPTLVNNITVRSEVMWTFLNMHHKLLLTNYAVKQQIKHNLLLVKPLLGNTGHNLQQYTATMCLA